MIDEHQDTLSGLMLAQNGRQEDRNRGSISSTNQVAGNEGPSGLQKELAGGNRPER
jgi:hypothetical protein